MSTEPKPESSAELAAERERFEAYWRQRQLDTHPYTDRECPAEWGGAFKPDALKAWLARAALAEDASIASREIDTSGEQHCAQCVTPLVCKRDSRCLAAPTMLNGLTESETAASASVAGLWTPEQLADVERKGAELRKRFKAPTIAPEGGAHPPQMLPVPADSELLSNMDRCVLRMPFDLAMGGHMAQKQFYDRVQSLLNRIDAARHPTSGTEGEQA